MSGGRRGAVSRGPAEERARDSSHHHRRAIFEERNKHEGLDSPGLDDGLVSFTGLFGLNLLFHALVEGDDLELMTSELGMPLMEMKPGVDRS